MREVKRLKNSFGNTTKQGLAVALKRSCLEKIDHVKNAAEEKKYRVEFRPLQRVTLV